MPRSKPKSVRRLFAAYWIKLRDAQTQYLDEEINGHKAEFPSLEKWSVEYRKIQIHFRVVLSVDYFLPQPQRAFYFVNLTFE